MDENLIDSFLTEESFAIFLKHLEEEKNCTTMEAVLEFCNDLDIEVSEVAHLIKGPLKEKIRSNAMDLGLMKKLSTAKVM